jgi:hypothetical protein
MNDPQSPATSPRDLDAAAAELDTDKPPFDFTDPHSPLAPYYFQTSHVLATLVIVVIFAFFNLMCPLWHSDVWGHLKIGEWIAANRELPARELFSPYSDPSLPASNFAWLSQVILYGAFRAGEALSGGGTLNQLAGGIDMLRALHALCEATKALFLLLAFRRFAGSMPLAITGVLIVFAFSLAPSAIQRPQIFAEVLFAAVLWAMSRPLAQTAAPLSWRRTFLIVGLLTLWANMHGSFLIGIALVGVLWLGQAAESIRDRGAASLGEAPFYRPLIAALVAVAALSLLNPHGLRALPEVLAFAKNPNIQTMQEWRPLEFSAAGGGHWGYMVLLGIIALTQAASPRVYGPTQLLLLAVFGFTPLLQERLMTWWVMLVPVVLLPMWAGLGAVSESARERFTSILSLRKTILAAGMVFVGVIWSSPVQLLLGHPAVPINLSSSRATLWPITPELLEGAAVAEADANLLNQSSLAKALAMGLKNYPGRKFQGRIFTSEVMGDYLIWSLPPKAPVMVYSHVHVFPPDYWDDYMEVLFAKPGWRRVLDRERVNLVVCQVELRQELLESLKDDPDWDVILDESEAPLNRWYRLFAALRKKPL